MTVDQVITAGGTAGLIAFALFVIYKLGGGSWLSKEAVIERIAEKDAAHAREIGLLAAERDRAIAAAELLLPAVERLTEELELTRKNRRRSAT